MLDEGGGEDEDEDEDEVKLAMVSSTVISVMEKTLW